MDESVSSHSARPANRLNISSLTPSFEYLRPLDGLRACAILLVFIAHAGFGNYVPGAFGVTLFFFISGLLITRLLLAELIQTGDIGLKNFYVRRLLRLYPAMLAMIIVSSALAYYVGMPVTSGELFSALFYYVNYQGIYQLFWQPDGASPMRSHPLGILWSLSVEEHYYLMFPLLLSLLARNPRRLLCVLFVITFAVLLWRIYLIGTGSAGGRIASATDTRLDSILYGAALAVVLSLDSGRRFVEFCTQLPVFLLGVGLLLFSFVVRDAWFRETLRYSIQGIALIPIVSTLCFSDRLPRLRSLLESEIMVTIGLWSYSIYLFHSIAIKLAEIITHSAVETPAWLAIMIPTTLMLSTASYYGIERPMRALRRHFGSRR